MKNKSYKYRRVLSLIAVLLLSAVALSACGKKKDEDDSEKDVSAKEPSATISAEADETEAPKPTEDAEPTEEVTPTAEPTEDVTPTAEPTEDAKPSEAVTPEPTKDAKPTVTPKPNGGSGGNVSTTVDEDSIKDIAEKGLNAMLTGDAEGWIDYTDIDVMYYMSYGEVASKQKILEELKDTVEDYADDDFGEIKVVSVKEDRSAIQKFSDFLKSDYILEMEEAPADTSDKFKIDGAYEVEFEFKDEDYTSSDTLYVLRINDEWKLAYWLTFMSLFAEYYEDLY